MTNQSAINVSVWSVRSWRQQFIELDPFKEWNVTKSMDIVNYSHSQCHPLDPKNNRKTLLASPIGVTTPATVRHRTPVTATVTSRDYYQNQQRPSDIAYTPMTFESNYFSNTYDYATVDSKNTINNNNNNNNHTKTSDFYELESKMYQEMNSYYHHSHHR